MSFQAHAAGTFGLVAHLTGQPSRAVVQLGLSLLHREASGSQEFTDGAGLLTQISDHFFRDEVDFELPASGEYATGLVFLPRNRADEARAVSVLEKYALVEGAHIAGWRDVPVEAPSAASESMPVIRQLFLTGWDLTTGANLRGMALERTAYCVRRQAERETAERGVPIHFPSLSTRTIVYKGLITPLESFYPDLMDERFTSAIAIAHSRMATTTPATWALAQPRRLMAHSGEFTSVRGNVNRMRAREALLASQLIPGDLRRLLPICSADGSDSASFDEVLELLHLSGRPLAHAMLMMMPPPWENWPEMDPRTRAFHQFNSMLMEPWDGPAGVAFTDGSTAGVMIDRRGQHSSRWWQTDDGLVVAASDSAAPSLDPGSIVANGRLTPGRAFLIDTRNGLVDLSATVESELSAAAPYADWLHAGAMHVESLPERDHVIYTHDSVLRRQQTFGYTEEELELVLAPMAMTGEEPLGAMGNAVPPAVLSKVPRLLYDYFHQTFAQATSLALDPNTEEFLTAFATVIGPETNLLDPGPASCRRVIVPYPVLDNDELAKIISINEDGDLPTFAAVRVSGLYRLTEGAAGLKSRLVEICRHVSEAVEDGVRILVLSDRDSTADLAPIPSLLLTAAVHQHLVREQTRSSVAIVAESGDCRTAHHVAVLLGYGATAVNPYLAMESVEDMVALGEITGVTPAKATRNVIKALGRGTQKIVAKMGVSTISSFHSSACFEAIGVASQLIERYFTGTRTSIGGIGLHEIHAEIAARHDSAYDYYDPIRRQLHGMNQTLSRGGDWEWRHDGDAHLFDPVTVFKLQHATRSGQYSVFQEYTAEADKATTAFGSLRGQLDFRPAEAVPVDEVEPATEIVKRFTVAAMSHGSISAVAHETLDVAMNRLGLTSNSGEGGEERHRFTDPQVRSAVKQVSGGRFGVTTGYLVHADRLEIKLGQGAEPGEGERLPAEKVTRPIADLRGIPWEVESVSPVGNCDVRSLTDLGHLINELKCVNPAARVQVKLASQPGIGATAVGVAKVKAEAILISGYDGGTGGSALGSIKHAGTPWELGLAEAQQSLLLAGLRERVILQVDGQLKTGRDVMIAALLGAEEFGFGTAVLVVSGCVMMRQCRLNTCPVGIATQDPALGERFTGKPEFVQNFFMFLAEQVREHLAALGLRTLDEAIGRADLLQVRPSGQHWKAGSLDLSPMLFTPVPPNGSARRRTRAPDHRLEDAFDLRMIRLTDEPGFIQSIHQLDQPYHAIGAMLAGKVTRNDSLMPTAIDFTLHGDVGRAFGAFIPKGITLRLNGDAADFLGKGLSGGLMIVTRGAGTQSLIGDGAFYGATSGEAFLCATAGQRFAVRNSGVRAVVEGIGDNGCEYMTGGMVLVLGPVGRNFAAGMTGGIAYVLDLNPMMVNRELVDIAPADDTLRHLVASHFEVTGSVVAGQLLSNWDGSRFTQITPRTAGVALGR
ncbi:glutamate synthase [Rhizocola hellebori]|uniref:Glutamate synthase n=1 Tax=Rhizocola hellebori TaxID=1392758 RepID=A0A8J3VDQ0_9ACTN|nr:glutamate synthase large subunit [Rhizocola hellebori]GIH02443.1 glutamate synthase [Rhizocola hellebori]